MKRRILKRVERELKKHFRRSEMPEEAELIARNLGAKRLRKLCHENVDDRENGKHFKRTKRKQVLIDAANILEAERQ